MSGLSSSFASGQMLEAGQVQCPGVAGHETEAALFFDPGLHFDAIIGGDATGAGQVLIVADVVVVGFV